MRVREELRREYCYITATGRAILRETQWDDASAKLLYIRVTLVDGTSRFPSSEDMKEVLK